MANVAKHGFVSAVPDGPDNTLVRPSNWNAEHIFSGGSNGQLLSFDNAQSDNVSWVEFFRFNVLLPPYNADPTGGSDSSVAIQQALDDAAAVATSGAAVYLPSGIYRLDNGLSIASRVSFIGDGYTTRLVGQNSITTSGITIGTIGGAEQTLVRLANFYLDITNCGSGTVAVSKGACNRFSLENIHIKCVDSGSTNQIGFRLQDGSHNYIANLRIEGGQYGIRILFTPGQGPNNTTFINPWITLADVSGFICIYGSGQPSVILWFMPYLEVSAGGLVTGIQVEDGPAWTVIKPRFDGVFLQSWNITDNARIHVFDSGDDDFPASSFYGTGLAQLVTIGRRATQLVERFQVVDSGGNPVFRYDPTGGFQVGGLGGVGGVGRVSRVLFGGDTLTVGPIADGDINTVTFAVLNASVGDPVFVSCTGVTVGGIILFGAVTSAGTVTITIYNRTGSPLTITSGVFRAVVFQVT